MDKLLVTYNTCGISRDNSEKYPFFLEKLVQQKFDGQLDIVVSACVPSPKTIPIIQHFFPSCHINEINDILPVNITQNHSMLESAKRFGKYDAYVYMSCDSYIPKDNIIQGMFNDFQNNDNYGILSAQVDIDSVYAYGLNLGGGRHGIDDERARHEMFQNGADYIIPIGKGLGGHVNFWSNKIMNYYGRCCPDIFAGYCTESVMTFIVAAIHLNWAVSKNYLIKHVPNTDIPSSGFRPENRNRPPYDHPFVGETLLPIFTNEKAKSLGLGYEECQQIVMHDPSQFDDNYFCKNNDLKKYIKDNLYLSKNQFDYDNINFVFHEATNGQ